MLTTCLTSSGSISGETMPWKASSISLILFPLSSEPFNLLSAVFMSWKLEIIYYTRNTNNKYSIAIHHQFGCHAYFHNLFRIDGHPVQNNSKIPINTNCSFWFDKKKHNTTAFLFSNLNNCGILSKVPPKAIKLAR